MAKFSIIPKDGGTARYSGCPTFTGTYMKPGLLEFREVSSPTPIDWAIGDYVVYTRTGFTYRLYSIPQLKKQARSSTYGGAFVYQGVQLFDASKMLEYCPFRDLVKGDNRIHFSTQPSISTFEGCDGLARRFEACLRDQYDVNGVQSWAVRIATRSENPGLYDLMMEPREFEVSGVNILECLDKIYEIWPEVGWIYKVENGIDTIVIGGGGINTNTGTYAYGKGNGLTAITRVAANADEIANRIFAYGSSRNMLPRWYNNQNIKNAASVDIQNLMIPVSSWGLTDNLPDPAKAFIEDAISIAKNGLRPTTVYFDGSGEYPEIYPTLRGATIGAVRTALGSSSAKYYPSTTVYTDATARVDALKAAQATFDSGKAGADGKDAILSDHDDISASASGQVPAAAGLGQKLYATPFLTKDITISENGEQTISVNISLSGTMTTSIGYVGASVRFYTVANSTETLIGESIREISADAAGARTLSGVYASVRQALTSGATVRIKVGFVFAKLSSGDPTAFSYSVTGQATENVAFYRSKTFTVTLRQIGFDINEQAALGDGKTIAMRSGDCVGRSFAIVSAQYQAATDDWLLECYRTEDESLSQWFPNTDYKVKAGDEFVLLDIAMPDIYVQMAEQRLLTEAQGLLADTAAERWQYTPEIDAKFMIENSRTIVAGQNMTLADEDIIGESAVSALVDTVTINEGESAIPTYKVTLRDRKRKTWTESEGAPSSSSKSVGTVVEAQQTTQNIDLSGYVKNETFDDLASRVTALEGESFFTLDSNGNVTLKAAYSNLWVPGWLASGGIGQGGSGGGGLITSVKGVADLGTPILNESLTETFSAKAIESIWEAVLALQQSTPNVSLTNGGSYSTLTINGAVADFYTKSQVDTLLDTINAFDYVVASSLPTASANTMYKIYLIPSADPQTQNVKDEYITIRGGSAGSYTYSWEQIGSTAIDLTGYATESWVNQQGFLTASALNGYATQTWANNRFLLKSGGDISGDIYHEIEEAEEGSDEIVIDEKWRITENGDATFGSLSVDGVDFSTINTRVNTLWNARNNYVTLADAQTITGAKTFTNSLYGKTEASHTDPDWYIDNDGSASFDNLHVGGSGVVTIDNAQTITGAKTFSGGITMSGADIIPSADLGSQLGYSNRRFSNLNVRTLGSLLEINFKSQDNSVQTGYLTFKDGWMVLRSGADIGSTYKQINFHETYGFYPAQSGVNLGYNGANNRWANIYGVNEDLSGNLILASTSHIDIGPARIEYDSDNGAIHITTSQTGNNAPVIGFYADGFSAAGGIGAQSGSVKYVNCATQSEYNAIANKSASTIYTIGNPVTKIYLGTIQLYTES